MGYAITSNRIGSSELNENAFKALALGYILPAVGRIGDFHPLKHAPAGRTKKSDSRKILLPDEMEIQKTPIYLFSFETVNLASVIALTKSGTDMPALSAPLSTP